MGKQVSLEILHILEEYTDNDHMMSKEEILQKLLDEYDDDVGEGAFYRKIDELNHAGYRVVRTRGKSTKYALNTHRFTKSEFLYLCMIILGSEDLSEAESAHMISVLSSMPAHHSIMSSYQKYEENLQSNNTDTNQLYKFSLIVQALEEQEKLTCKFAKQTGNGQWIFSDRLTFMPLSFRFDGKKCLIKISIQSTTREVQLKDMIDVENQVK